MSTAREKGGDKLLSAGEKGGDTAVFYWREMLEEISHLPKWRAGIKLSSSVGKCGKQAVVY